MTESTRHEAPDVAELRRKAESAEPFVRHGGTDPATVTLLASDVLGLLDRLAHMTEARDNARAEVERLTGQVEAVRKLHFGEYVEDEDRNRCFECGDDHPCPTIRAIGAKS